MAKIQPIIRKSGRHWVIDRGPGKAMPCCDTKAEAEQLLALSERWENKAARVNIQGHIVTARVVNTAILYRGKQPLSMLALRWNKETRWFPETDCEEVKA